MKIIQVDNFNRETISDFLVAENVSEYYGKIIIEFLNKKFSGDYELSYYRLIPDDYKLYEWKP